MHRKNGFTLIELMIVAAILGILAALIIPAVKGCGGGGSMDGSTGPQKVMREAPAPDGGN